MGALFSRSTVSERPPETWVAPPPTPPDAASASPGGRGPAEGAAAFATAPGRPVCRPFAAEVDCCELDERERPGPTWVAHTMGISRSSLLLRARRMTYAGRTLLIAVHLIDERPTPLMGRVVSCEYDSDGMHVLDLDLLPVPQSPAIQAWLKSR